MGPQCLTTGFADSHIESQTVETDCRVKKVEWILNVSNTAPALLPTHIQNESMVWLIIFSDLQDCERKKQKDMLAELLKQKYFLQITSDWLFLKAKIR